MHDEIRVFTQSSIRIEGSRIIYFDPFRMRTKPHDADVIFITHDHYDHFSPDDIAAVMKKGTLLVLPLKMKDKARETGILPENVITVKPDENITVSGLKTETVCAYNKFKPFHPKSAGWVGYTVAMDGTVYYVAGDTDMNEDNSRVRCDVALVPAGGTYTMDAEEAAEFVNRLHPSAAVPTHYGSMVGNPGDGDVFRDNVDKSIQVMLKMEY